MNTDSFVFISEQDIADANRRHDQLHDPPLQFEVARLHSSWNPAKLVRRGPLTDKKIAKYERESWHDEDFKQARLERMNKKAKR